MKDDTEGQKLLMQQRVAHDPAAAFRVLAAVWERQQPSEKQTGRYAGSDHKGFRWDETTAANELYRRFVAAGKMWQKMSAVDVVRCQRMMVKYAGQYLAGEVDRRDREIQRFKVNKHPPRPKLDKTQRDRIMAGVERMTDLPDL